MQSNQVLIRTAKGHFISTTMYGKRQTKSILIINSATGVKQHFYAKFAMFVVQQTLSRRSAIDPFGSGGLKLSDIVSGDGAKDCAVAVAVVPAPCTCNDLEHDGALRSWLPQHDQCGNWMMPSPC